MTDHRGDIWLGENRDNPASYGPPGYRPNAIHIALVLAGLLGRMQPLALAPAWLALAAIACWPWDGLRVPIGIMSLVFVLADGASLALLPRMGRSFGPVTPPLLALTLARVAIIFVSGLLWPVIWPAARGETWPGLLFLVVLNLALSTVSFYATWVEPFRVGITRAELHSTKLGGQVPLRLLHITDLHIERVTLRERRLLHLIEELVPDIVVLTGDYLTLSSAHDMGAQAEAYSLLARLCDIAGPECPVFAITGSPPVDRPDIVPAAFAGLPITWLLDATEELCLNGHVLRIIGLCCSADRNRDAPRLRRLLGGAAAQANAQTPFTLLLYHSPDLMPEAVELGVDLYLCGHTHGGQIRLPLFGALFTSSDFGKRYEMGRYVEANTTLYVSRGLGMEGLGAPRARFLAPPEIVLWTLSS